MSERMRNYARSRAERHGARVFAKQEQLFIRRQDAFIEVGNVGELLERLAVGIPDSNRVGGDGENPLDITTERESDVKLRSMIGPGPLSRSKRRSCVFASQMAVVPSAFATVTTE